MASTLYVCPADGNKLRTARDATDLIGEAAGADIIVIPVERLDEDFFRLRTGVAGDMLQKFVTYRKRVAIVGDVSLHVAASKSFHDFVYEANRGRDVCFVTTRGELEKRLLTSSDI